MLIQVIQHILITLHRHRQHVLLSEWIEFIELDILQQNFDHNYTSETIQQE